MANPLDLFPARVRFVDQNGLLTTEAFKALRALFERVGGASAPSNSELAVSDDDDSGLEEFKAEIAKSLDAFAMAREPVFEPFTDPMHRLVQEHIPLVDPAPLPQEHVRSEDVLTEIASLREQIATLQTQINDLKQGTSP